MSTAVDLLRRADQPDRARRTPYPASYYQRWLQCLRCKGWLLVFEACHGARSEAEHRFLDPDTYRCGDCLTNPTPGG